MIITIKGLDELITRMSAFPAQMQSVVRMVMQAVLLAFHEAVPGYPPQPAVSGNKVSFKTRSGQQVEWGETAYERTGTLGRTIGIGGGQADIYEVEMGGDYSQARFGTRLEYAPYVIGDYVEEQAGHMRHWWTLPQDVVNRAYDKIVDLFSDMASELARWLEGKGA